jgi:transposase
MPYSRTGYQKPHVSRTLAFDSSILTRTVVWSAKTVSFTSMGNLSKTKNIGIDVAKDELVIFCDGSPEQTVSIDNEQSAITELAQSWQALPELERIVIEASGGYEALAVTLLAQAGLPVCLVNPKRVRDFAKSNGTLAKTDRLDARTLASFAAAVKPPFYRLADAAQTELTELIRRRQQLVEMKAAEQTRLKRASAASQPSIKRHLAWLAAELKEIDDDLQGRIKANTDMQKRDELLQSVPGIGRVVAATLIAELPELGSYSNKQLASLVGLAPFACESGRWRGRRQIRGGRHQVRKALYQATVAALRVNQQVQAIYKRLKAQNKPSKVSLIAAARKLLCFLNAMIKSHQSWKAA